MKKKTVGIVGTIASILIVGGCTVGMANDEEWQAEYEQQQEQQAVEDSQRDARRAWHEAAEQSAEQAAADREAAQERAKEESKQREADQKQADKEAARESREREKEADKREREAAEREQEAKEREAAEQEAAEESHNLNRYVAQTHCEQQAAERSDDPGNVKFSGTVDTSFIKTAYGWKVMGWVDNPNGFGGHIRYEYNCDVEPQEGTDQVMVYLNITEL